MVEVLLLRRESLLASRYILDLASTLMLLRRGCSKVSSAIFSSFFPPHVLVAVNTLFHTGSESYAGGALRNSEHTVLTAARRSSKHPLIGSVFVFPEWFTAESLSQPEGRGGGLSFLLIYHFKFNDIAMFIAVSERKNLGVFLLFVIAQRTCAFLSVFLPSLF